MALLPLRYNTRSLLWRRSATLLTIVGVAATVAVLAAVLSLQQGFATLFADAGRDDLLVFLRPGATSEGESSFPRDRADVLIKSLPEIAENGQGQPLAAAEMYLAVLMRKTDGGKTNVPLRGVEPMSFEILGDRFRLLSGRLFERGADEIIVGAALADRIQNSEEGQVIVLNTTPFRVVGIFDCEGPYRSEIWGDADRMTTALHRPGYQRVFARARPGVDAAELAARMEDHKEAPATVMTEKEYLRKQTADLSNTLFALAGMLAVVMGIGATFTGTNTMLANIQARIHEIGVLLSIGFRPFAIFLAFLLESLLLGLVGGLLGCLAAAWLNGVRTGTTNFTTFTEVAFAFRVTPLVLGIALGFSLLLGLLAGAWPAWRAASLRPTQALRRE